MGLLPLGGDASLPRRLSEDEAAPIADAFIEWPTDKKRRSRHTSPKRSGLDCESRPSAWGYSPQGGDSYYASPGSPDRVSSLTQTFRCSGLRGAELEALA